MARPKKIKQQEQLSSKVNLEIDILPTAFKKTIGEIKEALKYQYGFIKKKIELAAKQLEETKIPLDHICSTIVQELRPEIEQNMIAEGYIYEILDEKYKQKRYKDLATRMKAWQDSVVVETSQAIQHWTGLKNDEIIRTPVDVAISSTTAFRKHLIISWSDEDIIFARQVLAASVPILADTLKLVEEEWQARRLKAKMLSR